MSKTDARGVVKTFDPYDRLNRVKRWTYTGGPAEARSTSEVTQSYDSCGNNSKGRLCSVTSKDSAGAVFSTTNYSAYDALGRAGQSSQTTNGQALSYTLSYAYNPAGLTSQTYPSGLVVKTGYDGAGRIAGVSNADGSLYYVGAVETDAVNRMQYTAHGGLQQMKVANGLWEETRFNARLQPLQIGLGRTQTALGSSLTQTNSDYLLLTYTYSSTQNNGNVATQRIQVAAATPAPALDLTQSYSTYDSLNRLKTASETAGTGTAWAAITYDFDRFGNRAVTAGYKPVPGQTPQALTEFNAATNRMVSPSVYDGAGNQTTDKAGCTTKYDGEDKMVEYNCGLGVTTYAYDGDGRRVKKVSGGLTTIYVYNVSGQLAAEYSSQGPTGTGISYLTSDHLGSTRVVTDANRSVKARRDYLPYGEEIEVAYGGRASIPGYGATENTRQRFTGKERDIESNLDYFGARYFSGAQGRFTTEDPLLNSGRPWLPQSWNRYAYVLNHPLKYTDPAGLYEWAQVCARDDVQCQANRRKFRDAVSYLKQSRDSYDKKSREYKRLDAALSAYGKENEKNGITVGFGALPRQAAGETIPGGDGKSFSVMFDPSKWTTGLEASKMLASDVGHEGTHVVDLRQELAGGGTLSDFSLEYRGYETSAFVFQGLFTPSLSANQGTVLGGVTSRTLGYGGNIIWNSSWSAADKAAIQSRDVGITNTVKSVYGHPETTPHNPWRN